MCRLKKIGSFFLLMLMLLLALVKPLHVFMHNDETHHHHHHCTENHKNHNEPKGFVSDLHDSTHECALCKYVVSSFVGSKQLKISSAPEICVVLNADLNEKENHNVLTHKKSRAPPVFDIF